MLDYDYDDVSNKLSTRVWNRLFVGLDLSRVRLIVSAN